MKPLFIPLKREYFDAFERGEKDTEYRIYGPRWNERVCSVGRPVVLSCGYGKQRRLEGVIREFRETTIGTSKAGELLRTLVKGTPEDRTAVAEIGIDIRRPTDARDSD